MRGHYKKRRINGNGLGNDKKETSSSGGPRSEGITVKRVNVGKDLANGVMINNKRRYKNSFGVEKNVNTDGLCRDIRLYMKSKQGNYETKNTVDELMSGVLIGDDGVESCRGDNDGVESCRGDNDGVESCSTVIDCVQSSSTVYESQYVARELISELLESIFSDECEIGGELMSMRVLMNIDTGQFD